MMICPFQPDSLAALISFPAWKQFFKLKSKRDLTGFLNSNNLLFKKIIGFASMQSAQDELNRRINHFKATLKHLGVKLTHQRMVIFQEVVESEAHPNAESIYKAVRTKLPMISLDTVYRTLWMLQNLGLIDILGGRDRVRFDGNMKPHHHFVCKECGLMRDFCSEEFDRLRIPKEVRSLGNGETIHIEVKGICLQCSKKSMVK
jgi:Fur family transcriptional regulator, peroxide stress response regulator